MGRNTSSRIISCDTSTKKASLPLFANLHSRRRHRRRRRHSAVDRRLTKSLGVPLATSEAECGDIFVADRVTSRRAVAAAVGAAERVSKNSRIIDPKKEDAIPRFSRSELSLGALLGKGGFSHVFEISSIDFSKKDAAPGYKEISKLCVDEPNGSNLNCRKLTPSTDKEKREEGQNLLRRMQRSFIAEHCDREKTGAARYAIKYLSESCLSDGEQFRIGASDLAVEAKFLSSLEHPNVIKLWGLASSGPEGFATGSNTGFFLILDRLYGTLEEKLSDWSHQRQKHASNFIRRGISLLDGNSKKLKQKIFAIRMKVALDIAGGLVYLHSHNIIYRDLKPHNIGFDIRGDTKIFDFGFAKELTGKCNADNTYKMTGSTGSLRYMAPEVARCQDYNLSADVYSYAILLWHIISLDKPYDGMDHRAHSNAVVYGSTRPQINPSWPESLRKVLKNGWHPHLHKRPKIDQVYRIVQTEVAHLCGEDETIFDQHHRRSTHVMGQQSVNPKCLGNIRTTTCRATAA